MLIEVNKEITTPRVGDLLVQHKEWNEGLQMYTSTEHAYIDQDTIDKKYMPEKWNYFDVVADLTPDGKMTTVHLYGCDRYQKPEHLAKHAVYTALATEAFEEVAAEWKAAGKSTDTWLYTMEAFRRYDEKVKQQNEKD